MKVTKIILLDTDGCTYSCDSVLAIATTLASAKDWIAEYLHDILIREYHVRKEVAAGFSWIDDEFQNPNIIDSPTIRFEEVEVFDSTIHGRPG